VLLPLNDGFSRIFVGNASLSNFMTVLTLPSAWATGMGFMFCYGRQVHIESNPCNQADSTP
jgi:hypothetical protein